MSSRDPITELMSALDVATDAITGDPRLEQAFTEALAHIDAGDPDTAARVLSDFLNSVCATTALPDGVLTHDVIDDATRTLAEQRTRGRNRPPATGHDDRTGARAHIGFPFLKLDNRPTVRTPTPGGIPHPDRLSHRAALEITAPSYE